MKINISRPLLIDKVFNYLTKFDIKSSAYISINN